MKVTRETDDVIRLRIESDINELEDLYLALKASRRTAKQRTALENLADHLLEAADIEAPELPDDGGNGGE